MDTVVWNILNKAVVRIKKVCTKNIYVLRTIEKY